MSRSWKILGLLIIGLIISSAGVCAYFLMTKTSGSAYAATDKAIGEIRMAVTKDFLYASHPQCKVDDEILITAHLFKDGQPIKKAGIPVEFFVGDGRFATLDANKVYTDEWGTASVHLRSYASGLMIPTHPYPLNVTAKAENMSAQVTIPITRHVSLNGTVRDRKGDPVEGATVAILYDRTRKPINAMGGTTTSDIDGKYRIDRVPTDLGDVLVYIKKGDLETYTKADFSGAVK